MAVLKRRIENEIVGADLLTRHVKLGIGGIREIEFIVQSFQVLRGARMMALRERSTLRALTLLARHKLLTEPEAAALADAYRFLRNVEHRLQMEMELQTHTIPDEERALVRLARSLGFASVEKFFASLEARTAAVRRIYEGVLAAADAENPVGDNWLAPEQLPTLLTASGFTSVPEAVKSIGGLLDGPGSDMCRSGQRICLARCSRNCWPRRQRWRTRTGHCFGSPGSSTPTVPGDCCTRRW